MTRRERFRQQIDRVRLRNERLQSDLWTLTRCYPCIDPNRLASALEAAIAAGERLDFRTRLLIRDSVAALERHWGGRRFARWLRDSAVRQQIDCIRREDLGEVGFPSLEARIMSNTDPDRVQMFLHDLGSRLSEAVRLEVGGAMALILTGYLSRGTEDIDAVDEVPTGAVQRFH